MPHGVRTSYARATWRFPNFDTVPAGLEVQKGVCFLNEAGNSGFPRFSRPGPISSMWLPNYLVPTHNPWGRRLNVQRCLVAQWICNAAFSDEQAMLARTYRNVMLATMVLVHDIARPQGADDLRCQMILLTSFQHDKSGDCAGHRQCFLSTKMHDPKHRHFPFALPIEL